ncbi:hypothetical protein [Arthrobacter sp. zg-Y769]|uniref:hypothetical protein n=1 Tax=Arthrobacter sp. zg-Y769 TaxID=2894191 RepID=UPI001E4E7C2E|nr:hypothetical protein [Arthrobacter sp. zg-Y769]MCC9205968.1 hypothetical protein [Arthrobacter sp. zg-Y769]
MNDDAPAPTDYFWDQLGPWITEVQTLSTDSHAYPLAQNSLLAGDELGATGLPGTAAVVRTLLDAAVDDIASAYALVTAASRLSPVAIPTLVRGTIELAGLGMWVLTGHGRSGRQERALRVAYDSHANAMKFHAHLSQNMALPPNQRTEAREQVSKTKDAAAALADTAAKAGLRKTRITAALNRTEALKEVDKDRETQFFSRWQLCSGFAHGLAWAPSLFHTAVGMHTMEGGGTVTISTMTEDRALAMLQWGQGAIEELRGTFGAGRTFITDDTEARLVSKPWAKMQAETEAKGLKIEYLLPAPVPRRPPSSTTFFAPSPGSECMEETDRSPES